MSDLSREEAFRWMQEDLQEGKALRSLQALEIIYYAKALYKDGDQKIAVKKLGEAKELGEGMGEISDHVDELQRDWNPSPIRAIPDELLACVFSFLDTLELVKCTSICKDWKRVVDNDSSLWGQNVVLKGSLCNVEERWKAIRRLLKTSKVKSISLDFPLAENPVKHLVQEHWKTSTLQWTFPFESLERFQYTGCCVTIDKYIWSLVNRCEKLKDLYWSSTSSLTAAQRDTVNDARDGGKDLDSSWYGAMIESERSESLRAKQHNDADGVEEEQVVDTSPLLQVDHPNFFSIVGDLRKCHLAELHFLMDYSYEVDDSFVPVLSQARDIYIDHCFRPSVVYKVLKASKLTMERLRVIAISTAASRRINGTTEKTAALQLDNLKIFSCKDLRNRPLILHGYAFEAPNLRKLVIDDFYTNDTALLRSSHQHLRELAYTVSDESKDYVLELLLHMPQCRFLTLNLLPLTAPGFTVFWTTLKEHHKIDEGEEDDAKQFLPNLRTLTIVNAPTLNGSDLCQLIQLRNRLGLPLQQLVVKNCKSIRLNAIEWLRETIPSFVDK